MTYGMRDIHLPPLHTNPPPPRKKSPRFCANLVGRPGEGWGGPDPRPPAAAPDPRVCYESAQLTTCQYSEEFPGDMECIHT